MATDTLEPHELDSVSSLPLRQRTELIGHTASVAAVAFNSNGEYCLSASYDKTIRLWNPYTSKLIKVYRGHGYQVVDVVVNNDNSQIASCGGDRSPFIWDVTSGKVLRKFKGHDSHVNCVAYGKDCNVLVSGGYDKTVRIWDCRARSNLFKCWLTHVIAFRQFSFLHTKSFRVPSTSASELTTSGQEG
eukprot:TRINITY_DN9840_c0_g1_i4.p1 TRINITY_DN9840_c0_g1~~TRINITY_DN9840_c0_g1_i4.p1  ORF type:complete len:188 (+),score=17.00 TRINITY_DN9840_c0_g1_i4:330-893(+)